MNKENLKHTTTVEEERTDAVLSSCRDLVQRVTLMWQIKKGTVSKIVHKMYSFHKYCQLHYLLAELH